MSKQVMQDVLSVLERGEVLCEVTAANMLRAEIARPVEPVGHFYFDRDDFTYKQAKDKISFPACIKLYAAPPDTEAMINNLSNAASMFQSYVNGNTSIQMAQATINALNAFIDKQGGVE